MIPVVRILLGGGPEALEVILDGVEQEPPIPVVIISGSGKGADILAYAHR